MICLADGSDLGGSLRNPASFCNVVGLRPSPGRVPRWPVTDPADTLGVEGPMARTVADTALLLAVQSGPDPRATLALDAAPPALAAPAPGRLAPARGRGRVRACHRLRQHRPQPARLILRKTGASACALAAPTRCAAPIRWLCGPGNTDQVALGVGEVAHHQARRRPLGAHPALPAQAFGLLQGGLDIGNADVEEHMAFIAPASADTTRDPGPVAGRDAVHEAVVQRIRHRFGDRGTGVELPAEQFAEVAPELRRLLPDDLEMHDRLSHDHSLRVGSPAPAGRRPISDDRLSG